MAHLRSAREMELRARLLTRSAMAELGLKRPTRIAASRHLAAMHEALEAVHRRRTPQPSAVILPPGLDRSALFMLPFRVRTWNCLRAAELFEGAAAVTAERLLGERNFGVLSLRDVVLIVEDFLHECIRDGGAEQAPEAAAKEAAATAVHNSGTVAAQGRSVPDAVGPRRATAAASAGRSSRIPGCGYAGRCIDFRNHSAGLATGCRSRSSRGQNRSGSAASGPSFVGGPGARQADVHLPVRYAAHCPESARAGGPVQDTGGRGG